MNELAYFFKYRICLMENDIDDLDKMLNEYKNDEPKENRLKLKAELKNIIENNRYEKTSHFLRKEVGVKFSFKKMEILLKYIYNKLCNLPTEMTLQELKKKL